MAIGKPSPIRHPPDRYEFSFGERFPKQPLGSHCRAMPSQAGPEGGKKTIILDKPSSDLQKKMMMTLQKSAGKPSSINLGSSKNVGVRILMGCSMVVLFATGLEAKPIVWEYRVVSVNTTPRILEATLNENGAQGWELVEINAKGIAIFKRQKAK